MAVDRYRTVRLSALAALAANRRRAYAAQPRRTVRHVTCYYRRGHRCSQVQLVQSIRVTLRRRRATRKGGALLLFMTHARTPRARRAPRSPRVAPRHSTLCAIPSSLLPFSSPRGVGTLPNSQLFCALHHAGVALARTRPRARPRTPSSCLRRGVMGERRSSACAGAPPQPLSATKHTSLGYCELGAHRSMPMSYLRAPARDALSRVARCRRRVTRERWRAAAAAVGIVPPRPNKR